MTVADGYWEARLERLEKDVGQLMESVQKLDEKVDRRLKAIEDPLIQMNVGMKLLQKVGLVVLVIIAVTKTGDLGILKTLLAR